MKLAALLTTLTLFLASGVSRPLAAGPRRRVAPQRSAFQSTCSPVVKLGRIWTPVSLDKPDAVVVGGAGNIWVANKGSNSVSELSPSGSLLGTYRAPSGTDPDALAIGRAGNIWVRSHFGRSVAVLRPKGSAPRTYPAGNGSSALVIDRAGNVWVTRQLRSSVTELSPARSLLGTYSVGKGPDALAIDRAGNIWMANESGDSVTELGPKGARLGEFDGSTPVADISVDGCGKLAAAHHGASQPVAATSSGLHIGSYTLTGERWTVAVLHGEVRFTLANGEGGITRQGSFRADPNAPASLEGIADQWERFRALSAAFPFIGTDNIRGTLLKTWASLRTKPPVPKEAQNDYLIASGMFKAAESPSDFQKVAAEFRNAVAIAPWWPPAYWNLALALEQARDYAAAIDDVQFYLESKPADSEAALAKLGQLEIEETHSKESH